MRPCSSNEHYYTIRRWGSRGWVVCWKGWCAPVVSWGKNCWRVLSFDVARVDIGGHCFGCLVNIFSLYWDQGIWQNWENIDQGHGSLLSHSCMSCRGLLRQRETLSLVVNAPKQTSCANWAQTYTCIDSIQSHLPRLDKRTSGPDIPTIMNHE